MRRLGRRWLLGLSLAAGSALASVALSCSRAPAGESVLAPDADDEFLREPRPDAHRSWSDPTPPIDAPHWNGEVPMPGEWDAIPGMSPTCGLRVARDPKSQVTPFPWRPCARSGCQTFLADWSAVNPFILTHQRFGAITEDENGVLLASNRWVVGTSGNEYGLATIQPLHGEARLGLFYPSGESGCMPNIAISKHGFAITATVASRQTFSIVSPASNTPLTAFDLTPQLGALYAVQAVGLGDGYLTVERTVLGLGRISPAAFDLRSGRLISPDADPPLEGYEPHPVAGGYMALVELRNSIHYMPLSGGHRAVIEPLPGHVLRLFTIDRADNDALVWEETDDNGRAYLYTSPFATSKADLRRRAVAQFPFGVAGVANKGMFVATGTTYAKGRLVRLSDGLGWEIPADDDVPILFGAWVNDSKVWFFTSFIRVGQPGFPLLGGMLEVDRAELGSPTVPNGL